VEKEKINSVCEAHKEKIKESGVWGEIFLSPVSSTYLF
jgi:hypothetical protein